MIAGHENTDGTIDLMSGHYRVSILLDSEIDTEVHCINTNTKYALKDIKDKIRGYVECESMETLCE